MSMTAELTTFLADLRYEDLPERTRESARAVVIDHLACAAGGAASVWGAQAERAIGRWGGTPEATVVGRSERLPTVWAAFLNGHYGNMLDFDDTLLDLGHPGTCIVPAALATAEREGRSGAETLAAIVAGYEIAGRIAVAMRPGDARFRLIYPTSWHGIGPAVATAKLLGLGPDGVLAAVGVAAEIVPLGTVLTPETTYAFKSGKMGSYAASGVIAAQFAAEGMRGKDDVLDESTPLWLSFGSDRYRPELVARGLGSSFQLDTISFKPYPSCRFTHSAVDAVQALVAELPDLTALDRIEVQTFSRALQLDRARPDHAAHGPFCFPYVVAVAALAVPPSDWYTATTLADPEVASLAERVDLIANDDLDRITDESSKLPAIVTLVTDSERRTLRVDDARGDPERPLSAAELDRKFFALAHDLLTADRADAVLGQLHALERVDIGAVLGSFARSTPVPA